MCILLIHAAHSDSLFQKGSVDCKSCGQKFKHRHMKKWWVHSLLAYNNRKAIKYGGY